MTVASEPIYVDGYNDGYWHAQNGMPGGSFRNGRSGKLLKRVLTMTDIDKEISLRAKRAHERMHGQSTYIEAHYMPSVSRVRVSDHELGIVTYWHVNTRNRRMISFEKQIGERR